MEAGGAIGIDVGSNKAVMAAVRQRGIDIILSDSSSKFTPTVVAYTEEERLIGDAAMNQIKKNFKNTLQFATRFLGLNTDCVDQLKEEEKFITYKVVPIENKKVGFEVMSKGKPYVFTPEQVLAYFLKRTCINFEKAGISTKEIVVSVPSYYSNVERQAVLDACEIAQYKCLRLINESTAICLNYGFFRKADLPEKGDGRLVMFVDLGHSKTTVTIALFHQGKVKILCHNSDRNIGGRNMDYLLAEKIGGEFANKYGCDPRKNPRTVLRMLDAIEKQRKILSGNVEGTIHLESLMEDEDLHRNLKREEFNEMITPIVDRIGEIITEAMQRAGVKQGQIHSVELVGDATRIMVVQDKIKEIVGIEQLSRTLNSVECVARGCSLQSAMLSPLFKVADYEVQEYNSIPVSISYQFNSSGDKPNVITKDLFSVGSTFPSTKSITFDNKKGGLDLLIHYQQGAALLPGLPTQIAQYKIKEGNPSKEKFAFILRVSNNIHQIPCLESADLQEEWVEEEKIPVKKDTPQAKKETEKKEGEEAAPAEAQEGEKKPEEQKQPEIEYEIKKKNKKQVAGLQFDTQAHALPPSVRKQYSELEAELFHADSKILKLKEVKNDLESYIYDIRANIQEYGNYEKYIDPAIKQQVLDDIQRVADWIYEHNDASIEDFESKLIDFKTVGEPIKARFHFYTEIKVFMDQYNNFNAELNGKIEEAKQLNDEMRNQIIILHGEMDAYIQNLMTDISHKQTYQDPGYNIEVVHTKIEAYKKEVSKILVSQPPKPKEEKPAEKKEEAPKEVEDQEMKKEDQEKKE